MYYNLPSINSMHEIICFHGSFLCSSEADGTGIIDDNINATKCLDSLLYRLLDLSLVSANKLK